VNNKLVLARANALKGLRDELHSLSALESLSADQTARVNALPAEIEAAKAAINAAKALEAAGADLDSYLTPGDIKSLSGGLPQSEDDPYSHIVPGMPGAHTNVKAINRMIVEGKAGTELARVDADGRVAFVDGEGWTLDVKTFKAISEPTYKKAFNAMLRGRADGADYKALIPGLDSDGGWLAPPEYIAEVISRKPYPTEILSRYRSVPCSRDKVIWPRNVYDADTADIYTSPVRLQFGSDQAGSGENDPVFGDVEVSIYTGLFPIELNRNLMEDSAIPLSQIVTELAGEAYRLGLDYYSVVGTGNGQPLGLTVNPGGVFPALPTQNMGNPVTANGLSNLTLLLPPQYRQNFDTTCLLTSTVNYASFANIQDTSGQYIYGLDRQNGPGGMTQAREYKHMGYDIVFSAFMPSIGAGNVVAAFGDFRAAYVLAQRVGLTVFPYGDQDKSMLGANKVGWYFRCRAGGQPVQNRAVHLGVQS
jgi:HK97 family phage major capsid protein